MIDTNNNLPLLRQQYLDFENIWEKDEDGVEFVYARNLQKTFQYSDWGNFSNVINKAVTSCNKNGIDISGHFDPVSRTADSENNVGREIRDYKLTRYACYLIAQNGDPRKSQIAFAQHYFAVQTRRFEKILERMKNMERIESREKLKESEKEFGRVAYERGVRGEQFGIIKSKGDKAFFGGYTTQEMKKKLDVPQSRPLHDFTPGPVALGKALANAITTQNVKTGNKRGAGEIEISHVSSNKNVRDALIKSGITPENVSREQDIKKIEREVSKEDKKIANQSNRLKK